VSRRRSYPSFARSPRAGTLLLAVQSEREATQATKLAWLAAVSSHKAPEGATIIGLAAWTDIATGVAAVVQSLAIAVGGAWAYFKFVRGRTFTHRGELRVAASLVTCGTEIALKVTATFRNTGLSQIRFSKYTKLIYVYRVTQRGCPARRGFSAAVPV
jgi:hypothetical protein